MWWEQAVIYQVYVRSFQDTNGDGVGDLPGVTARLPHIAELGAEAVWLSPIYPSPNADFGYDVSDFRDVEAAFGTLADLDALIARAHQLGLKVLLDFVPCHTSTEHAWFREHPDYYVWADAPVNNWRAAFGGSAWGRDPETGRYFLHSFFPEQVIVMTLARIFLQNFLHVTYVPVLILLVWSSGIVLPIFFYNSCLRYNLWWLYTYKKPVKAVEYLRRINIFSLKRRVQEVPEV